MLPALLGDEVGFEMNAEAREHPGERISREAKKHVRRKGENEERIEDF